MVNVMFDHIWNDSIFELNHSYIYWIIYKIIKNIFIENVLTLLKYIAYNFLGYGYIYIYVYSAV